MTMIRSTARLGRTGALVAFLALAGAVPAFAQDTTPLRGTITVDEAVKRALDRNHDLLTARENIESAEGRQKQAVQRYLPGVDASQIVSRGLGITVRVDDESQIENVLAEARKRGGHLVSVQTTKQSLEELFVSATAD